MWELLLEREALAVRDEARAFAARVPVEVLDLGPADECAPSIHERRICWLDLRDGWGTFASLTYHGEQVYCLDLDTGLQWRASEGEATRRDWPSVFGDWVAWEQVNETAPDAWTDTIGIYHRRLDQCWMLEQRASWILDGRRADAPRVWGDYLYFLFLTGSPGRQNVFRCDLRVLFPEAYE